MRTTFKIGLCALALSTAPLTRADELGRLFFTPEQRAQLDYSFARTARPDDTYDRAVTLNGIVQKHGGKRTAWINGTPQEVGRSDERTPESLSVAIPGQSKPIKLKVGQRALLGPSASPEEAKPNSSAPGAAEPDPSNDD